MQDPSNFLGNGLKIWRFTIAETAAKIWFGSSEELLRTYLQGVILSLNQEESASLKRGEIISGSLRLLADVEAYREHVFPQRPPSRENAIELLRSNFAFETTLKKGELKGRPLLCFTRDSLLRLLKDKGMDEKLLKTFLDVSRERGILTDRKNIRVGEQDLDAEIFLLDELNSYGMEG